MNNNRQIQERIAYADVLRIMATFAVIIVHVCAARWGDAFGTSEWEVLNVYDSLVRWCVPAFLMLSGMLFLNPTYSISYSKLFQKTIPRIVFALTFWGFVYGIYGARHEIFSKGLLNALTCLGKIGMNIIFSTPWFHLWFLYVIIGLYLLTPAIRIFISAAKEKDVKYILFLFIIFTGFLKVYNDFSPYKINFAIPELSSYMGYFIAGYYFATYDISRKRKYLLHFAGFISMCFTIYITATMSHLQGKPYEYFYNYLSPNIMIIAFSLFILLKDAQNSLNPICSYVYQYKYLTQISGYCFGIYLIHDLVKEFVFSKIAVNAFNPIFSIPILAMLIFMISLFAIILMAKIPVFKKWIM